MYVLYIYASVNIEWGDLVCLKVRKFWDVLYIYASVNIECGDLVCFVYLQQSEEIWCVLYIYDSVSTAHVGRLFTVNRHNLE